MKRELAAGLVVEDGRLLLVRNIKHGMERFEPPGGKRRVSERPEETVVREAAEELGLRIRPVRLLGVYDTSSPEGEFPVHMYVCEVTGGAPEVLEAEKTGGFGWYDLDGLLALRDAGTLVPNMALALEEIAALLKRRP